MMVAKGRGIATFLGGARAPLAVGLLKEATGLHFSFIEWSTAACMISWLASEIVMKYREISG